MSKDLLLEIGTEEVPAHAMPGILDELAENAKKALDDLRLTYKDISHRNEKDNPNRRWGYDEVKRWLNGEDVPVPGEITGTVNIGTFRINDSIKTVGKASDFEVKQNMEAFLRYL